LLGALLGSTLGALAIYGSGGVGGALSRLVGFLGAFPGLLLVGLFRLGDPSHGVLALLGALSLLRTLEVAQLVRAELLEALLGDFVEASRALGASRRWQVRAHVVPRLVRPLAANLLQGASTLIGLEAALSFVGLGLPAGVPSWGGGLATVALTQSVLPLGVSAASIGLTCAALYGLGASLAAARPLPGRAAVAPLVALGAAGSGS
jgi:ABC-type dipeptide/oligopeptide/nickel transport system permease subunit